MEDFFKEYLQKFLKELLKESWEKYLENFLKEFLGEICKQSMGDLLTEYKLGEIIEEILDISFPRFYLKKI